MRPGDQLETLGFAARRVGPRMHHEPLEPQRVRAIQLGAKRVDRPRAQSGIGGRKVDQVAVVRDDRMDAGLVEPAAKERDLFRRQQARPPLTRGLREDLQRIASGRLRPVDGARKPSGDGHVRA